MHGGFRLKQIGVLATLALFFASPLSIGQTEPTSRPGRDLDLVPYLVNLYSQKLKDKNWVVRALAVLSLDRLPGELPADRLLVALRDDPAPAVRLFAWEALFGRAKYLNSPQHAKWIELTGTMAAKNQFIGETRVSLVQLLAISPATLESKKLLVSIFGQTNGFQPHDVPVLNAVGDCVSAWRSPDVTEYFLNRLSTPNDAYRAEYVLHRAGCPEPWAGEHMDLGSSQMWRQAIAQYANWWQQTRPTLKENKSFPADAWKSLPATLIVPPDLSVPLDPHDHYWAMEQEGPTADLRPLDLVFVVDATGSMQPTLDFLLGNIGRIKSSLELVSQHVRIGVTCYRDFGDSFLTRSTKLTDRLNSLDAFLSGIEAHGGGDRPEAVLEALTAASTDQPWSDERNTRKVIVLMTDAPPHPNSQSACIQLATAAAARGVSLQIMKVKSPTDDQSDLVALDAIAEAAGTEAMWMPLPKGAASLYSPPAAADGEERSDCHIAAEPEPADADQQLLRRLIGLAIHPQYANRIDPFVNMLLAITQTHEPENRTAFGVPEQAGVSNEKPQDPQAR